MRHQNRERSSRPPGGISFHVRPSRLSPSTIIHHLSICSQLALSDVGSATGRVPLRTRDTTMVARNLKGRIYIRLMSLRFDLFWDITSLKYQTDRTAHLYDVFWIGPSSTSMAVAAGWTSESRIHRLLTRQKKPFRIPWPPRGEERSLRRLHRLQDARECNEPPVDQIRATYLARRLRT